MTNVLGIDGGGTKTVAVLTNQTGQLLGAGDGGPSNYQSAGIETAKYALESAILQATKNHREPITAICLGLAGVGRPEDVRVVRSLLEEVIHSTPSVKWSLQPNTVVICSDSAIALTGGVGRSTGIVVIAGTGSMVFGQNSRGITKRAGGWGYLLGDEGGGYNIAIRGLQAALRAYDGRGMPTILVEEFQKELELRHLEDLVKLVYRSGWKVKEIAALTPVVDRAAVKGDAVANTIIDEAVEELVLGTRVVSSALFSSQEEFEIVTMGGIWHGQSHFRRRFETRMEAIAPPAKVIWPRHQPALGAAILALATLGQYPQL
jgi:N-acetylglucosamine kinase